jgi:hypothetical protein
MPSFMYHALNEYEDGDTAVWTPSMPSTQRRKFAARKLARPGPKALLDA